MGIILLSLAIPIAIIVPARIYRFINPYLDREIAGTVTISNEWLEIKPKEPLNPERKVQYIYVLTPQPFQPDNRSWGIRFPDGSVVVPEVQLIDQYGKLYNLKASAFSLKDRTRADVISGIGFHTQDLPQDRVYTTVRLRSDKPVEVSRIIWRCYDPRDRK